MFLIQPSLIGEGFLEILDNIMASYPSFNDRDFDLVKKIAWNFHDLAVATGVPVTTEPRWNDTYFDLLKKITYFTAILADSN